MGLLNTKKLQISDSISVNKNSVKKNKLLNSIFKNKIKSKISLNKILEYSYIENISNGYILFYHDPFYKTLPINGWIHNCLICNNVTSKYFFYKNKKDNDIYLQICSNCQNLI